LWKEKWVSAEVRKIEKRPVNRRNQHFFDVDYTLPGGLKKFVSLCDIHCRPGAWSDTTSTPAAPLLGVNTKDHEQEEQDLASIDLLEAPSIADDGVFRWTNHNLFGHYFPTQSQLTKHRGNLQHKKPNLHLLHLHPLHLHPLQFPKQLCNGKYQVMKQRKILMNLMMMILTLH
jgi:hypothetical protein